MKEIRKTMYIIVDKRGHGDVSTLNYFKTNCITNFLKGTNMRWNDARKYGWRCKKVDIIINLASPEIVD